MNVSSTGAATVDIGLAPAALEIDGITVTVAGEPAGDRPDVAVQPPNPTHTRRAVRSPT